MSTISIQGWARTRGGALLSQAAPPSSETADFWLIRLRAVAIAGMLATTLIAKHLVPDLVLRPILGTLLAILATNVLWSLVVMRRGPKAPPLVTAQILVDVGAVTIMLWWSGGTSNPFAAFLTFHIVLAGLLCGWRTSLAVAALTLVAIGVLCLAQPIPLASAPLGAATVERIGRIVSLASLSAFIGFFVWVYVQRVAQLRAESARNEKLAMLGRLVGAMSHELNTPLATILLASKDLVEVGRELNSEEATRLAQTIVDEVERASGVIGLVRGHVRPDQHLETVELCGFVREHVERELGRLGFAGEWRVDAREPLRATVHRAGIGQVLTNVLTNANQALGGSKEGRIEVSVASRRGGRIEIGVKDNGPGISRAVLARLGEPFQTTKADGGGMGLGLYVSSVIAERMDAVLRVEPLREGGTRVTLGVRGMT
jgi:two-component system sensor histidine kinase RegB